MAPKKAKCSKQNGRQKKAGPKRGPKGWPAHGEPLGSLEEVSAGITDAIRSIYSLRPKGLKEPLKLKGPDRTEQVVYSKMRSR